MQPATSSCKFVNSAIVWILAWVWLQQYHAFLMYSARSACGNFLWLKGIDSFDLAHVKGRSLAVVGGWGWQFRIVLPQPPPFRWVPVHNANCGNDDEESISDYEVLSHIVRRWRRVTPRWWWWGETTGRTHTDTARQRHTYSDTVYAHIQTLNLQKRTQTHWNDTCIQVTNFSLYVCSAPLLITVPAEALTTTSFFFP